MPEYAAPVALGIKVPTVQEGLAPISTMLDMRAKAQQIQQGGVQLQQQQMDLQERNGLRDLAKNIAQYRKEDGTYDINGLSDAALKVSPKLAPDWIRNTMGMVADAATAHRAVLGLGMEQRRAIGQTLLSTVDQPKETFDKVISSLVEGVPQLAAQARLMKNALDTAPDVQTRNRMINQFAQSTMEPGTQKELRQPSYVPTGGELKQTAPFAAASGAKPSLPMTLPPTAGTVDKDGNPIYVGGKAGGGQPVAAGPKLGQAESAVGTAEAVNKDWSATQASAQSAAQDIGVLQNIKKYAPGAITGVTGDKRAYAEGIAGLLGINAGEIGKTSTDLLIKNSNMQALGGQTDAARVLLEGANPNVHMTKEAILKAADQVIAQRKMALEKQRFMQPYKNLNDPGTYTKALAEFNQHADPRILQLQDMSKEEKQQMMGAMSANERAAFVKKVRRLHELGVGRE